MIVHVDLVDEIVILVDGEMCVRDAFAARGITRHECDDAICRYTYRSLLIQPGSCAVCGVAREELTRRCTSSGGYHAFVGLTDRDPIPREHRAESRSISLVQLRYDELVFFVAADNLFDIAEIRQAMIV